MGAFTAARPGIGGWITLFALFGFGLTRAGDMTQQREPAPR